MPCPVVPCHALPRLSRNADDTPHGAVVHVPALVLHVMHRPAAQFGLAARNKSLTARESELHTPDKRDRRVACGTVLSMRSPLPEATGRVRWHL